MTKYFVVITNPNITCGLKTITKKQSNYTTYCPLVSSKAIKLEHASQICLQLNIYTTDVYAYPPSYKTRKKKKKNMKKLSSLY